MLCLPYPQSHFDPQTPPAAVRGRQIGFDLSKNPIMLHGFRPKCGLSFERIVFVGSVANFAESIIP